VALWLYALARRHADRRARSALLLSAALVAAALAALSKEIALLLPVWVAVLEWGVLAEQGRRVRRALVAAVWFSSAAGATIALRAAIVGLASGKLTGGIARLPNLLAELGEDLPAYVLLAGLPFPFGFLDRVVLDRFWWLGAVLVAAGLLGGGAALIAARRGPRAERIVPGLFLFAMAIISSSLFPVFWAGLNLRRRYLFVPSVGFVLIAALVLHEIGRRRPRCARALLGLLVVIGSLGTVYRNELYRQSGNVARAMIEAVRGTPLDVPLASRSRPRAVLVELPFRYGGDSISGAYLFHHTDFRSALIVYGVPQPTIEFAMRSYFADDREASVTRRDPRTLEIRLRYRTRRAFEDAIRNDPTAKPRGKLVRARRTAVDRDARTLTFELRIDPEFWTTAHRLFLYANGDLSPVLPLESGTP
jgi:hypothetical protein